MSATPSEVSFEQCAYCGEPLVSIAVGVVAWRVGNRFVCNEFCADGVSNDLVTFQTADHIGAAELPKHLPRCH
jgi:hypothetical protein